MWMCLELWNLRHIRLFGWNVIEWWFYPRQGGPCPECILAHHDMNFLMMFDAFTTQNPPWLAIPVGWFDVMDSYIDIDFYCKSYYFNNMAYIGAACILHNIRKLSLYKIFILGTWLLKCIDLIHIDICLVLLSLSSSHTRISKSLWDQSTSM